MNQETRPVGRTLARLLRENEIEPTIIEMNLETVHRLRGEGRAAIYGDASHRETLAVTGVNRAASVILTVSVLHHAEEIIRLARKLNPTVHVLVRCSYLRELPAMRPTGADRLYSGEGEVALTMTESVLRKLGAIPEQISRERDRVRADLFVVPLSDDQARANSSAPVASGQQVISEPESDQGNSGPVE